MERMHYTTKSAWAIVGGFELPKETHSIELNRSDRLRFVLTNNPDELLADVDKKTAFARIIVKVGLNQSSQSDFPSTLQAEIDAINAERAKLALSRPVLVAEATGETNYESNHILKEYEGISIEFGEVNSQEILQFHQDAIDRMKLSIVLEGQTPVRFITLGGDTYLTSDTGKTIYPYSLSTTFSEGTVTYPLPSDGPIRISDRYSLLQNTSDLETVMRLFLQMSYDKTDRLKKFLSGWLALEIFIQKAFKHYESDFFSPLIDSSQPSLRKMFLKRIQDVMCDKYKLTDKFTAVTAVLFPDAPDNESHEDLTSFKHIKVLRDSILHGEEFSERNLPVQVIAILLRKYLLAYIDNRNSTMNVDAHDN